VKKAMKPEGERLTGFAREPWIAPFLGLAVVLLLPKIVRADPIYGPYQYWSDGQTGQGDQPPAVIWGPSSISVLENTGPFEADFEIINRQSYTSTTINFVAVYLSDATEEDYVFIDTYFPNGNTNLTLTGWLDRNQNYVFSVYFAGIDPSETDTNDSGTQVLTIDLSYQSTQPPQPGGESIVSDTFSVNIPVTCVDVPEPSLALLGVGAIGLLARRRKVA